MDEKPRAPRKPPSPRWLEEDNPTNRENSRQSKKHEQRLAARLGGKRYSGSGNRPWARQRYRKVLKDGHTRPDMTEHEDTDCGDLSTPTFHFEHKFTRNSSLSVKLDWLDKVEEGAKHRLKDPGLIITFQGENGEPVKEYVAMPLAVYERLMKKSEETK